MSGHEPDCDCEACTEFEFSDAYHEAEYAQRRAERQRASGDIDWRQIAMASERSNRVLHDLISKLNAECKSLRADLVRARHEGVA